MIYYINHFHNGDVFLSKEFIRYFMGQLNQETHILSHPNSYNLLKDIDALQFTLHQYSKFPNDFGLESTLDYKHPSNDIYINSWVGAYQKRFIDGEGCCIQNIYRVFSEHAKTLYIYDLPNINYFLPRIDFNHFDIAGISKFMSEDSAALSKEKVFVSNNFAQSGQAENFNMDSLICHLSKENPNKLFLITNREFSNIQEDNVIYTSDIIGRETDNLNENAYISTFCDHIIGRSSGAFTFALNKENLLRNCSFYTLRSNAGFNGFDRLESVQSKFFNINDLDKLNGLINE